MSSERLRAASAWLATLLVLACVGGLLLFNRFMFYDDEGYVLWSVRSYLSGGSLYNEVYSQYGPLFFVGYRALCSITGLVLDSDSGRLLTLGYWLASATLAGACVRLLQGGLAATLAATGLAFLTLANNTREPFHPGSLLALVSGLVAWWGVRMIMRGSENRLIPVAATLAAAAALIKINVGALLFIPLGAWVLVNGAERTRVSRALALPLGLLLALVPGLLMARNLDTETFQRFALVTTVAIAGLFVLLWRLRHEIFTPVSWVGLILLPVSLTAGIIGLLLAQGSTLSAIANGIVLGPLRHPGVYNLAPHFPPSTMGLLALAVAVVFFAPRLPRGDDFVAALKIAGGVWFLWECLNPIEGVDPDRFVLYRGPALALIFTLPFQGAESSRTTRAALWLAWIYIWQTLHAYPVAGSQIAWGCYLWVPLAIHGIKQGLDAYMSRFRLRRAIPDLLILGGVCVGTMRLALIGVDWLVDSRQLGFAGARWLHVETQHATDIIDARRNLIRYADTVFSLPGTYSFNLWTGKPTPSQANATHWFNLLNAAQQQDIVSALEKSPRPVLVITPVHLDYLRDHAFPVAGPLVDYIKREFQPTIDTGIYELWMRRDQTAPGLDSFVITGDGLRAYTETLDRPVVAAALRKRLSPDLRLIELRPSPAHPWKSEPAGPGDLQCHRLSLAPVKGQVFSDQLLLDLLDQDGKVLATCRYDRLRQKLIDAAPPATN